MLKKVLLGIAGLLVLIAIGGGGFVFLKVSAFDASMAKVYSTPLNADFKAPDLKEAAAAVAAGGPPPLPSAGEADPAATDKAQKLAADIEAYKRGKHLAESIGACMGCHGHDLATPEKIDTGPLGEVHAPNISMGGTLKEYTDPELHRLLTTGVKRDGHGALFMPSQDFVWWPDADIAALIGFLRTMPAVDKQIDKTFVAPLGKVLDQMDMLPFDTARRLEGKPRVVVEAPTPTKEYGKHLATGCQGCHGETLSGGPIPGAPSSMPVPKNITPHATGIAHYDFAEFERLLDEGIKADGGKLDPFMPIREIGKMNEIERKALWAFLQAMPPKEFGGR